MKTFIIFFIVFSGILFVVSGARTTEHRSINFFTTKLNKNLRDQYNDHISRLRRAAQTPSPASVPTLGTTFKVGACRLEDFLHVAKNCSREFYESVRGKGAQRSQCGSKYKILRKCMLDTMTNCINNSRLDSHLNEADEKEILENFLIFLGNEKFWCDKGGLGISSEYLPAEVMCHPVYYQVSEGCTATYSKLFNSSASDDRLCREYRKAKKCYLETIFRHCSFTAMSRQILEIMIEITADFQPFCKTTNAQEHLRMENLLLERKCPPYSLSDIAFVLDVTNGTKNEQFAAMKRMVEGVTKRLNYGWGGIQVSVFQFDLQLRTAMKYGRAPTKSSFQKSIRKMKRTEAKKSKNKGKRMTGRSLSSLARGVFSPNKNKGSVLNKNPWKSGQRPYNTAVAFVLTTGQNSDSMSRGLGLLADRNVHVAFVAPKDFKVPTPSDKFVTGSYRLIDTDFKFKQVRGVVTELVEEICTAEKKTLHLQTRLEEGRDDDSKWRHIKNMLRRFREYDLALLFELKPIIPSKQPTTSPPNRGGLSTSFGPNPFNPTEGDGTDGDYEVIPMINEDVRYESPTEQRRSSFYSPFEEYLSAYPY